VELSGRTSIDASRQRVWSLLTDLRTLGRCGPSGLDAPKLQQLDDRRARMTAQVGGGLFGATLVVDLELRDLDEPNRATLGATGGAAGTQLSGAVTLALSGPEDGPTEIAWTANLALSGPFAAMGEGLVRGAGTGMIDGLLDCLRRQVASPEPA
jgi:carbon monoxide dehydrogenase subunit G